MKSSKCFLSRIQGKLAPIILVSFLAGCGKTTHTVQSPGQEGMSLGNGEYLFPMKSGELRPGKITGGGHPPAGTVIVNPKTKGDVLDWLERNGVKFTEELKPVPQETRVK